MSAKSFDRRQFLRHAALSAATIGAASAATSLAGCGSNNPSAPRIPAAPTDLVAQAMSAARVELSWTDNATDETSYEVERRNGSESTFTLLATLASDQTGYVDQSVAEHTIYIYRVRAVAEGVDSNYSNESQTTTPSSGAPITPTAVRVDSVSGSGAVIAWNDVVTNETGFRIERIDGPSPQTILTVPADATQGALSGLPADTRLQVQVVAFNDSGSSAPSAPVAFFTGAVAADPHLAIQGPGVLRLTWSDRTAGRIGFDVQRDSGTGFATIAARSSGTTSYDDSALPLGKTARYRVAGHDVASTAAAEASMEIPAAPPAAPGNFAASPKATNGAAVVLAWQANDSSILGFHVQRRPSTGAFTTLLTGTDGSLRSYEDSAAPTLQPVVYRVLAWNLAGLSTPSVEAPITPRAVFFLTGSLAALNTINKGVAVQVSRPSGSLGSSCNSSKTSIYLVRENDTSVAAVVAHCTHECLTPPSFHWVESSKRYSCSHGSQFDIHGALLQGPANRPVPRLATALFSDRVEVLGPMPA